MTKQVPNLLLLLLVFVALPVLLCADEPMHAHTPIVHRSRPVIERLPLRVVDPVDVAVSEFGATIVADRVGRVVFRVDARGDAHLLGKDLDHLSRVVYSKTYGPHVLQSGKGSGHIIRITEGGYRSDLHIPFKPVGLGVDREGSVVTANASNGNVWKIDAEGKHWRLAELHGPAVDLVVDTFGTAIVLLKSGKLMAVFSNGTTVRAEGYLPAGTTRIAVNPAGQVVGLSEGADGRVVLLQAGSEQNQHTAFAGVPQGTTAFAFDRLGNLTMANPDLRAVTRVTSRFQIPCPHCGEKVEMVFSPDAPLEGEQNVSSF